MRAFASISIRLFTEADIDALYAAVDESRAEVSRWMAWCTPDYSREHASQFINASMAGHANGTSHDFAVCDARGVLAGVCGINHINLIDRFANLGYWTRSSCTQQGIAPAAVLAVAEWAFANTPLNRLQIVAAVDNVRSQRVAIKAGALREGVLRQRMLVLGLPSDAVMHSLIRRNTPLYAAEDNSRAMPR
jgi:RimJ/RimL family protein N-acetyltransferase